MDQVSRLLVRMRTVHGGGEHLCFVQALHDLRLDLCPLGGLEDARHAADSAFSHARRQADGAPDASVALHQGPGPLAHRLHLLQSRLTTLLPAPAGLSPRLGHQVCAPLIHRPQSLPKNFIDMTPVGLLRLLDLSMVACSHLFTQLLGGTQAEVTTLDAIANLLTSVYSLF